MPGWNPLRQQKGNILLIHWGKEKDTGITRDIRGNVVGGNKLLHREDEKVSKASLTTSSNKWRQTGRRNYDHQRDGTQRGNTGGGVGYTA